MLGILGKFLDTNEKEINRAKPLVAAASALESEIAGLTPEELKGRTASLKARLASGESFDSLIPEAFALTREAAKRTLGQRHYDVQLIAALVLHQGKIAEQKTGEGKTLSASPAVYVNTLSGRGVHVVTVNDYLSRRDTGWMGPIYHALGLSCTAIVHERSFLYDPDYTDKNVDDLRLSHLREISRKEAYEADVTYGTNNEFGFDYLRDNMVWDRSRMVQRGHHYAIVDEVDSILIDEARTPLIISAPDTEPTHKYYDFAKLIETLTPTTDFVVDEKLRTVHLTEHGITKVEKRLGVTNLYEKDFETIHHIEQALKAKTLYFRDRDYVVQENQVVIVDEFTGRLMFGRRYSEGLHQAIEAKENVPIQQESRTLATISFQNYFRMYEKLAGMTGTAATEAEEFHKIYALDVVVIPTHRPMIRQDLPDLVYKTQKAKYTAIANLVLELHKKGQSVLIGTTSIEKNEILHELLKRKGTPHEVLNAKNHEREALIIEKAGDKGAVTLATNMAGRGVDIKLGHGVEKLGGLFVIGSERHEARRIDNQLRGRSGRQGDPGASRFFVALDDDIMRLFGGEQVARLMTMLKIPEDVPIEHGMVSKAIENAQVKVEGHNFDIRKHLVEYDDVMNKQREIIYRLRREVLDADQERPLMGQIQEKIDVAIRNTVRVHISEGLAADVFEAVVSDFASIIPFDDRSLRELAGQLAKSSSEDQIVELLQKVAADVYRRREEQMGAVAMRQIEKFAMLSTIDSLWMDHLDAIDDLREGIGLRGYAQRDPLVEYKAEAYTLFEKLMADIDYEVTRRIFRIQIESGQSTAPQPPKQIFSGPAKTAGGTSPPPAQAKATKIGRNDPCPCGSGRKYKKCHGR